MKIGEVSKKSGIPASTLRYYEGVGLIPKPARAGGQRVYDPSILDYLAVVDLAKAAGFAVTEIHQLLRGFAGKTPPSKRWRILAERKQTEVDERIKQLKHMKVLLDVVLGCECPSFTECAQAIRAYRGV